MHKLYNDIKKNTMKKLFLVSIVAFTLTAVHGQTTLKYAPELGLAFSQFPKNNSYSENGTMTTTPLYSPLIGGITELTIKKHLQFTTGLEYQMTGQRFHSHQNGYNIYNGNYTSDTWEKQTFHKLCFPMTVGFKFKIWKLQPSLFAGYRLNYFFAGKYYSESVVDHDNPARNTTTENEFNPFDGDKLEWPIRHFNNQFLYGISTSIGQHLKISFTFNSGRQFSYKESAISCFFYSFPNNDYLTTVTYLFKTSTKSKTDYPHTK